MINLLSNNIVRTNEQISTVFQINIDDFTQLRTDKILNLISRVFFELLKIQNLEFLFFLNQEYLKNGSTDFDYIFFFFHR